MKKLKVVTIVGTRPELIRLSLIIKKCDRFFNHILVHTNQNYDYELNQIFFDALSIREPDYFLDVPGEDLGETLGNVISKSFNILSKLKPDALLVLGDTNSSLSIIPAKRLKIPIFHMEAGNRCFDYNVPEEINRKIADHIADINICYTENSRRYLISEGFRKDHVITVGSPLFEVLKHFKKEISESNILKDLKISPQKYILASIHREENLDIKNNLDNIIKSLEEVGEKYSLPIIFSTHPRTKKKIKSKKIKTKEEINFIKPLGFFNYIKLQQNSFVTLSDSGSLIEESSILKFPAVSIRNSTERPEGVDFGTIVLGNLDVDSILQSVEIALNTSIKEIPNEYSRENVSDSIIKIIQGKTNVVNKEIWKKN